MNSSTEVSRASTGIGGLDNVLHGGLVANRLYLLEGSPGAGKTTLAFQFLLEGVRRGESVLHITLSESAEEIRAMAASHGWSLDRVMIREQDRHRTAQAGFDYHLTKPVDLATIAAALASISN